MKTTKLITQSVLAFFRRSSLLFMLSIGSISFFCMHLSAHATANNNQQIAKLVDEHSMKFLDQEKRLLSIEAKVDVVKDYAGLSQKQVDWWIAFLSIFFAVIGLGAPIAATIVLRASYRAKIAEVNQVAEECKRHLAEIVGHHKETLDVTEKIKERNREFNDYLTNGLREKNETKGSDKEDPKVEPKLIAAIAETLNDPASSDKEKIIAHAIQARKNQRWDEAVGYFQTLALLDTSGKYDLNLIDAKRRFSQMLSDKEALKILRETEEAARKTIPIQNGKNNISEAWFLLGDSLFRQANYVTDRDEKRRLLSRSVEALGEAEYEDRPYSQSFALCSAANAIENLAKVTDDIEEKVKLYRSGLTRLERALKMHPESNWTRSIFISLSEALIQLLPESKEKTKLEKEIATFNKELEVSRFNREISKS